LNTRCPQLSVTVGIGVGAGPEVAVAVGAGIRSAVDFGVASSASEGGEPSVSAACSRFVQSQIQNQWLNVGSSGSNCSSS
jgi:hypothetical protein